MISAPFTALLFALATFTVPDAPDPAEDAPPAAEEATEGEEALSPEEQVARQREALPVLYDELAAAPDEETAATVAAQIETLWEASGSATADLLSQRATDAMTMDDPEMAARHLDDALRFAPNYAEGWVRRAQLYTLNDEHSEALAALEKALIADPRHFRALLSLAQTLDSMESPEGAYEAYGEVLKVYPHLVEAQEARARLAPVVEGREL
jgi:tetratricopeptide (TPR) repeat protein